MIKTQEILNQLDACATDFTFPVLDNGYVYLATTKLHVYKDDVNWRIIIEVLGFNYRTTEDANVLYVFGNDLDSDPGYNLKYSVLPTNMTEILDQEDDEYIKPGQNEIMVRDKAIKIVWDKSYYENMGIEVEDWPQLQAFELLRSLVPEHRDTLLATEKELAKALPSKIDHLLTLEEWYHPDIAKEEKPGETETFQMVAQVLQTGDVSKYQPTKKPNTHWSYWPEGGTL